MKKEETKSDHQYITFMYDSEETEEESTVYCSSKWKISEDGLSNLEIEVQKLISECHAYTVDEMMNMITRSCDSTLDTFQTGKRRRKPVYWWNSRIEEARKNCIKKRRYMTRLRTQGILDTHLPQQAYKEAKKKLKWEINESKREHWTRVCEEINQDIWGFGYKIVTKKLGVRANNLSETLENDIVNTLFPTVQHTDWTFPSFDPDSIPLFTLEDLADVSLRMKNKKAPGPDGIAPEIVKQVVNACPDYILKVLNKTFREVNFPDRWKKARVVLLPKPGKPLYQPSSYRPLCLLDTFGKLLEGLLVRRLFQVMGEDGLSKDQYGFRSGRSTIDAVQIVYNIADQERRKTRRKRGLCLVITLDIRNAFNSAPWAKIIESLETKNIPLYIIGMFMSYFKDRYILTTSGKPIQTSLGCPQGSIASPTLWNLLYDGVLAIPRPPGVSLTAYADDLAVSVVGKTPSELEDKANSTLAVINDWMYRHGLQLAPEKSEAILLIGRKRCGPVHIHIGGAQITVKDNIKYLGVILDTRMTFREHVAHVTNKANSRVEALHRLMPRRGGATYSKRKLYNSVVESTILYAAPVWHQIVNVKSYLKMLVSVQRRMALSITRAYRTTSTVALQVIAAVIPIDLMIEERAKTYKKTPEERQQEREETISKWNLRWPEEEKGAWTRLLIPDLTHWVTRTHGDINYYLSQFLSGHGNFRSYLHRFKIKDSPACIYCQELDTPEHVFVCPRWSGILEQTNMRLNTTLTPTNIIQKMLSSVENWNLVLSAITEIMSLKEIEEKERRNPVI